MKVDDIKQVAVIGAGAMGAQIAQVMAQVGGFTVTVNDIRQELVDGGMRFIREGLKKFFVDKGKMSQAQMDELMSRIQGNVNIEECVKSADFVIEAAFENLEIKQGIFKQVDQFAPARAILASNTSNNNITDISSVTNRRDKVVGMHFFNPVAVMKLVEIVKGALTSQETVDDVYALARKLGKEPVICKDFSFGFLANRAYAGMINESVQMLWERVAPPEDIDKALKLGYNLPMGPLELGDFTGAWKLWFMTEAEAMRANGPEKGHLHPLIRNMVRAGYTGGRGKKGIYDYYREVMLK